MDDPRKIDWLFDVVDSSRIQRDSNFKTIVFSDTLLAFNTNRGLSGWSKSVELMFLIELVQELAHRITGSEIAFRAVITEGEFNYRQLKNFEAYYGSALLKTYDSEKAIKSTGLFIDSSLRDAQNVFRTSPFVDGFDSVFTMNSLERAYHESRQLSQHPDKPPFAPDEFTATDAQGQFYIYCEIQQLRFIRHQSLSHPNEKVRAKYISTWKTYLDFLPEALELLEDSDFDPRSLFLTDWAHCEERFDQRHLTEATQLP